MSVHRIAASVISAVALTAGALTGGTAGATGPPAAPEAAAGMVSVSIARSGAITMPAVVASGVTTFKVTTVRRVSSFQLLALVDGYTVEQAQLDVENGLEKGRLKALRRFEAHAVLLGGAPASSDKGGKLAVDLEPGTYYALDTRKSGAPWLPFAVSGAATGAALPSDATLKAIDSTRWAKSPASIPRSGWLTFKNRADKNHFVVLAKLKPGKTVADFAAALEDESGPSPVDFRFSLDSGVLSPGHDMAMKYRLPRGSYVLTCFWPDASMGGMPHVAMGMYRGITVR